MFSMSPLVLRKYIPAFSTTFDDVDNDEYQYQQDFNDEGKVGSELDKGGNVSSQLSVPVKIEA